jgi:flagellar biosynthesis protein FlhG
LDQADSLREMVGRPRPTRPPLRVFAITSGKGGVGKTHLTANLAVLAARSGRRVLLIDADLGLANAHIVLGVTPKYHLGHLLDGSMAVDDVLAEGPHGVRILGASSGVQELTQLDDAQKLRLITALDPLEDRFDLVLIDCGAGIGDNVVFFAAAAQLAVLVVAPEPTSLTDAYAAVKVLSQHGGVRSFAVVVNSTVDESQGRDIFQKLTRVTDRFLQAKVTYAGSIPRDENLQRALLAQQAVVDLYPQSPSSRALGTLRDTLLSWDLPPQMDGGLKFLWQRLLRESTR